MLAGDCSIAEVEVRSTIIAEIQLAFVASRASSRFHGGFSNGFLRLSLGVTVLGRRPG
jgi:hypothetical protein